MLRRAQFAATALGSPETNENRDIDLTLKASLPCLALLALAACDAPSGFNPRLPESVIELAGPNQDLSTARVLETDNCYWYDHKGVVETTPLPLRTAGGQQICLAKEEPAAPAPGVS